MYNQLLENKKKSFSSLLTVEGDFEQQLARINSEWLFWLREYYTSETTVKIFDIPFYTLEYYDLCNKIVNKEALRGFNPTKPFFRMYDKGKSFEGSQLFISTPKEYEFFSYKTGSENNLIPKYIKRELDRLPEGIIIGIYSGLDFKLLTHLSLDEYRTKGSLKKIGVQLESLRRFTKRYNYCDCCDAYVVNSEEDLKEFERGLICKPMDGYFDLELWEKM